MKLFVNHLDRDYFFEKFQEQGVSELDFSLFVDWIPQGEDQYSEFNFISMQEPNEYFKIHDWVMDNSQRFTKIFTMSDRLLYNLKNSEFCPFGNIWITPEQDKKYREKKFEISHLCGVQQTTYGHWMRHEILKRQNEIKMPTNFHHTIGDRYQGAPQGKEIVFGNSKFGIVIENTSTRGYFTEKIMDLFALKTIPLYWGCSNIGDFFDTKSIITFQNVDDLIYKINNLQEDFYQQNFSSVLHNYKKATLWERYDLRIVKRISEILKNI